MLDRLQRAFDYPVKVIPVVDLPRSTQRRIANGDDVASNPRSEGGSVVAALKGRSDVVRLGPFPNYNRSQIEASLAGWMRLTAHKLNAVPPADREVVLEKLQTQFDFPLEISQRYSLPNGPQQRIIAGEDSVFFPQAIDRWYAATPLSGEAEVLRFGPFPSFERSEQKAATTTLALVLLPSALAIALLLRPVAQQLRRVENVAKAIAEGDLSARVDERRVGSAKPLAHAFNDMAGRTETLVRTQRELLQAVSHELRTPLSRMRFAIDLVETAKDDVERKQRLESLDAATEELDELVGELISYVRMESAEPQLNREHVAVHTVLSDVIPKYAALRPSINFHLDEQVGRRDDDVYADRHGFQRVMGNLLSNAGRHAESNVKIHSESTHGITTVDVDDDGLGIPMSDRERVFEPFVRLEDASNGNGRGVGLGLALVKRIVTQHGGSVEILSSPLGGCRIRTTWPGDEAPTL